MKKVLIVSAHPDDEVLGAGGTILKHKLNGDEICWTIVTNILDEKKFGFEKTKRRQEEIQEVSASLGVKKLIKLDYPTMELDDTKLMGLISKFSQVINDFQPEIIYTTNRSDAHSDHRIVFNAVAACTKSFRYPFIKTFLMYECISETEFAPALHENLFIPNYFVDISEFLEEKIKIMNIYSSELGNHPFPRSDKNIRALATFRGASVGVEYAEAFQLIKHIDK